eukprot:scaffold1129_cov376-Prasinococcus_capsulatus_cf.AAC.9
MKVPVLTSKKPAQVCICTAAVAKGVPIFSLMTDITGGIGCNFLAFILTPVFYVRLRGKTSGYWRKMTIYHFPLVFKWGPFAPVDPHLILVSISLAGHVHGEKC